MLSIQLDAESVKELAKMQWILAGFLLIGFLYIVYLFWSKYLDHKARTSDLTKTSGDTYNINYYGNTKKKA